MKILKPFNLEEAKAGKPVVTREGNTFNLVAYDLNFAGGESIVGNVVKDGEARSSSWFSDGRLYMMGGEDSCDDLFMAPTKKEGWINIYKDNVWESEDLARDMRGHHKYIGTVKVEWHE